MRVHPAVDLPLIVAALRPDGAEDREAMDQVAKAMIEVFSGGATRWCTARPASSVPPSEHGRTCAGPAGTARRFLRRCGPACPKDLAEWIGSTPADTEDLVRFGG
jgi:hypothetical protein